MHPKGDGARSAGGPADASVSVKNREITKALNRVTSECILPNGFLESCRQ